jgi:phage anti-repressor protein
MMKTASTIMMVFLAVLSLGASSTWAQQVIPFPIGSPAAAPAPGPIMNSPVLWYPIPSTWTQWIGPGKERVKAGPVEVHPFLGVTEFYNDNIYRNYGGLKKEEDYITTLSPGMQLRLPVQQHSFQLDYRADVSMYAKNNETNYTNQRGGAAINLDFPGGLLFDVSDYYSDAVIPRYAKETPGISGAADPYRQRPYNINDLNSRVRYRFLDRWGAEVRYNNLDYRYKNSYDDSGTFNRNLFGGSIYYRITPKIDALVDYNYSSVDYKTNIINDNHNQSAYLGLSFDPTAKLNGSLKLGWFQKHYENAQPGRNDTFNSFSTLVDLTYNISRYHVLMLRATQLILEDLDSFAPYTVLDFSLGYRHFLIWNPKINLNATIGYGTKSFERPTTDADGSFKTRNDKIWYGGIGIGYAIQTWLSAGLNYFYTNDDSNFINYNYQQNVVMVYLRGAF